MKTPDELGWLVHEAWLEWARQHPDRVLHPNWILPWEKLSEGDKEVDRRIGVALACEGYTEAAEIGYAALKADSDYWKAQGETSTSYELLKGGRRAKEAIVAARDRLKAK